MLVLGCVHLVCLATTEDGKLRCSQNLPSDSERAGKRLGARQLG